MKIRLGHVRDRELMKEKIKRFEEKRGCFLQHFVVSETLTLRERVQLTGLRFEYHLCFIMCEPNPRERTMIFPKSQYASFYGLARMTKTALLF